MQSGLISSISSIQSKVSNPGNSQIMIENSLKHALLYDPNYYPFNPSSYSSINTMFPLNQVDKRPSFKCPYPIGLFYEQNHQTAITKIVQSHAPKVNLEPDHITNVIPPLSQEIKAELQKNILPKRNRASTNNGFHRRSKNKAANYYWSKEQNRRYCRFLAKNAYVFSLSINQKKYFRINVMMSNRVKTRSAQQCHSHHQKMIKKFGSIPKILKQMMENSNDKDKNKIIDQMKQNQDQVKKE